MDNIIIIICLILSVAAFAIAVSAYIKTVLNSDLINDNSEMVRDVVNILKKLTGT